MNRLPYPSDLTDAQWQLIQPLLPAAKSGGRPRKIDLCDVVNAIFYLNREGCTWRALPHDFPHWRTVYDYFAAWKHDGTWERINGVLWRQAGPTRRIQPARTARPSKRPKRLTAAATTAPRKSRAANAISLWTAWDCCWRRRSRRPTWRTPSPPSKSWDS